jgi:hypothetical protein
VNEPNAPVKDPFKSGRVGDSPDLARILALPRRDAKAAATAFLIDELTEALKTPSGTMRLRGLQALSLVEIAEQRGGLLPLGVGDGKTLASFMSAYVLDAKNPILVLPASLIPKTEDEVFNRPSAYAKHWLVPTNVRMVSYEILGRAEHADVLEIHGPDLIIFDECFVAGTKVLTARGVSNIEDVKVDDLVWAYDGERFSLERVLNAWSRVADETCAVSVDGHTYETTGDHPFLTSNGWKKASDLEIGDQAVCALRDRLLSQEQRGAKVLRHELLGEMAHGAARDPSEGLQREDQQEDFRDESESDCEPSCVGAQAPRAGGQRSQDVGVASSAACGSGSWLGRGEADAVGQAADTCIFDRHLPRAGSARLGSGRKKSHVAGCAGEGLEEDRFPRATRLARVESVERGRRDPTGAGRRVYNLHVERANTYVLESGVVVHNCHKVKNPDAAVTKRFLRYMEARPETMVVAMSGTIMDHSLLEFAHILRWALKGSSPVPLSDGQLAAWASALDVKAPRGNEFARYDVGQLVRLAEGVPGLDLVRDKVARARQGFRARLVSTPGIVASDGGGEVVNASINIRAIVYAPTKKEKDPAEERFKNLRGAMKLTDDWELTTPMEVWAKSREMAAGLSYHWDPRPPDEWRKPRQAWTKFVRQALKRSSMNGGSLDSPSQVEAAVLDGTLTAGAVFLKAWLDVQDTFVPNVVPVWHDDLAIDACIKWAKQNGPGIIWTEHSLFAHRLAQKSGLKYYGEGGLADDGERIEKADPKKSVIASADANKEGRNLQFWSRNLITTLEGRPGKNQQMIGRTHRSGQEADEVTVDILVGCLEHLNAWRDLIPAATAVRDTTGASQKVLLATVQYWPSELEIAGWTGSRWVQPDPEEEGNEDLKFEIPV